MRCHWTFGRLTSVFLKIWTIRRSRANLTNLRSGRKKRICKSESIFCYPMIDILAVSPAGMTVDTDCSSLLPELMLSSDAMLIGVKRDRILCSSVPLNLNDTPLSRIFMFLLGTFVPGAIINLMIVSIWFSCICWENHVNFVRIYFSSEWMETDRSVAVDGRQSVARANHFPRLFKQISKPYIMETTEMPSKLTRMTMSKVPLFEAFLKNPQKQAMERSKRILCRDHYLLRHA